MKIIGVIGGVGWPSTIEYYRLLNQEALAAKGSPHSAELILYSYDYARIAELMGQGRWDQITNTLILTAKSLETAGAQLLLIACNTLHKVAEQVRREIGIPLLHIADAAAEEAQRLGFRTVGLLGTSFVMEQEFYKEPFVGRGIRVIIPDTGNRKKVDRIIMEELSRNTFLDASKSKVLKVIADMREQGAEAIVLGCTELPLLIRDEDSPIRLLNTTAIHVRAAVTFATA